MTNLPATPIGFNALSPQQQEAHRAKIGVRARSILGTFWRDDNVSDAEQALEIEGWMDVLENCSHSEIRKAWANYQRSGPRTRTGKLYKPDAGALYRLIINDRPRPRLVKPEPEAEPKERMSRERAAEILQEAGVKLNKFGGVVSLGGSE